MLNYCAPIKPTLFRFGNKENHYIVSYFTAHQIYLVKPKNKNFKKLNKDITQKQKITLGGKLKKHLLFILSLNAGFVNMTVCVVAVS